jgi:uncharacterized protein (TIRG00374 family)
VPAHGVDEPAAAATPASRSLAGAIVKRSVALIVMAVVLYLLAPGLISVFGSWQDLEQVSLWWFLAMIVAQTASFAFVSLFTRLVLPSAGVFGITCAQLAGHALSTVIPGGAATGGAVEYKMLVGAGAEPTAVGSAMTVQGVVLTAAVFVLPVFALPAVVLGAGAPGGLLQTAFLGFGVFLVLIAFGAALMVFDRPVRAVAALFTILARLVRRPVERDAFAARLLAERDGVRERLGRHWFAAVVYSVGKWLLEYLTLLLALKAVGAQPRPSLVLLAYTASAVLSMIPVTPGGLGFVEAGLAGTLALAGVSPGSAALATLSYRLVNYWLPLPVGLIAWVLYRRRHHQGSLDDEPLPAAPRPTLAAIRSIGPPPATGRRRRAGS